MAEAALFLGTGLEAMGSLQQASAQRRANEANERNAEFNARLARQQGQMEQRRIRRMARQVQGEAITQVGASGLQMEGSVLDVMENNAFEAEMDVLTTRYNAEIEAINWETEARMQRMGARQARQSGWISAGTSLLMGASQYQGMQ